MIAPESAEPEENVEVEVRITDVDAGHKIPTGITENREMWLELTIIRNRETFFVMPKETSNPISTKAVLRYRSALKSISTSFSERDPIPCL